MRIVCKTTSLTIMIIVFSMMVTMCDANQEQPDKKKRVLLLFTHQTSAPINLEWERGIRGVLADGLPAGAMVRYAEPSFWSE